MVLDIDLDRRYLAAAGVLLLVLVFLGGVKYSDLRNRAQVKPEIVTENNDSEQKTSNKIEEEVIQVYVTGAVEKPGVYRLPAEARVYEALNMAVSLPVANLKIINLASRLEDGQAIVVPAQGEDPGEISAGGLSSITTPGTSTSKSGKVNINTASLQELDDKLPGIGPAIAQRIIDYRNTHGAFSKIEDLNEISGIGDAKYTDVKDLITVR